VERTPREPTFFPELQPDFIAFNHRQSGFTPTKEHLVLRKHVGRRLRVNRADFRTPANEVIE